MNMCVYGCVSLENKIHYVPLDVVVVVVAVLLLLFYLGVGVCWSAVLMFAIRMLFICSNILICTSL